MTTARPTTGAAPPVAHESPESSGSTERTAEIPVVRPDGRRPQPPVELADGTLWYPGVSRRLPAPFSLRLVVWLLFFFLLVGLAGLVVQHYHPSWLSFLRRAAPSSTTSAAAGTKTGAGSSSSTGGSVATGGSTGAATGFHRSGANAKSTTYAVPASSYSIVLRFTHPVWVEITSPIGSSNHVVEQVLATSDSPKVVRVHGSATVYLGASTTSLSIVAHGHTLGVVRTPDVGHDYDFRPSR